uniref:IS701 family transposase n=1 Tax=Streptomyces fuscichromogenes TaxID=1324013 RepID=UPI0027E41BFD|nr:transposase [Streptomyces fuscichromogenes]
MPTSREKLPLAAGRTENCQIGVFAAYTSAHGRALVDRELYLPKSWTEDLERCRAAKVPDEREFATKGELARHMVLRALASPLPIDWVTADSAYGQDNRFRRLLEQSGAGYVLAVPKSQFTVGCPRIDGLFAQAPNEAWEKISCGDGAKGPRIYHWAAVRLPAVAEFDYQGEVSRRMRWALARRSISRPDEVAYYLAYAPLETTVQELVRVAGHAGRSRSVSRLRRTSAAWISTRSAVMWAGIGMSPSPCSRTHSWLPRLVRPRKRGRNRWDRRGHRAHSDGGSATPGSLSSQTPAPARTSRTTSRAELVELAPPTPGNRPPLSLPAALSHDRGAVSVRPPPHVRSPATLPPPGERPGQTAKSCWSTSTPVVLLHLAWSQGLL